MIKEERADLVKHHLWVLWTDYFKPNHLEEHPDLHDMFWKATKLAGESKKSLDPAQGQQLLDAIDEIDKIFWEPRRPRPGAAPHGGLSRRLASSRRTRGAARRPRRRGRPAPRRRRLAVAPHPAAVEHGGEALAVAAPGLVQHLAHGGRVDRVPARARRLPGGGEQPQGGHGRDDRATGAPPVPGYRRPMARLLLVRHGESDLERPRAVAGLGRRRR